MPEFKASRLVIDGAASLAPDSGMDVEDFVRSLVTSLEDNLGCTTVLTVRTFAGVHSSGVGPSAERLSSGVIDLMLGPVGDPATSGSFAGCMRRSLRVRKMRGGPMATGERAFDIVNGRGLVLQEA